MENHRTIMDALRKDREIRSLASEIRKYDEDELVDELKSLKISALGSKAILRDRLLRAEILRAGLGEQVPWYDWDNGGVIPPSSEEALTAILNHKKGKTKTSSKRNKEEITAGSASHSEVEAEKETENEAGDESLEEIVNSSLKQIRTVSNPTSEDDETIVLKNQLTASNQLQRLISAQVLSAIRDPPGFRTTRKSIDPTSLLFVDKTTRTQPGLIPAAHFLPSPDLQSNMRTPSFMGIWPYVETNRDTVQPSTGAIKKVRLLRKSLSDDGRGVSQPQTWELGTPKSRSRPHIQPARLNPEFDEATNVEAKKPTEAVEANKSTKKKITLQSPDLPWFAKNTSKKPKSQSKSKSQLDKSSSSSDEDSDSDVSEEEKPKTQPKESTPARAITVKSKPTTTKKLKKKRASKASSSSSSSSDDSSSSQESDTDSSDSDDQTSKKTKNRKKESSRRPEKEGQLANQLVKEDKLARQLYQLQIV